MTLLLFLTFLLLLHGILSSPSQKLIRPASPPVRRKYFDVQSHRGGRGETIENTLPAFAWALIDGATTLELDNGITKDGVVVVWHDEEIFTSKCRDTEPAFPGDPAFPYVGKYIANLTFAQLRTLDCGSLRQNDYPEQLTYPGTRISTLQEIFDFVSCADPDHKILWNIESKVDASFPNRTQDVHVFVEKQHEIFEHNGYQDSVTYQSFDWRSLAEMKQLDPTVKLSALIDDDTAFDHLNASLPSPWLAGLDLSSFPGPSIGEKVAQAARALGADILSPSAESFETPEPDPTMDGYVPFTSAEMVREAHKLGLEVKVWSVNRLNILEQVMSFGVDGIITDYPNVVRRWAKQHGLSVAPEYPEQRVLTCLDQHLRRQRAGLKE